MYIKHNHHTWREPSSGQSCTNSTIPLHLLYYTLLIYTRPKQNPSIQKMSSRKRRVKLREVEDTQYKTWYDLKVKLSVKELHFCNSLSCLKSSKLQRWSTSFEEFFGQMGLAHFVNSCLQFLEVYGIPKGLFYHLCQCQLPQEVGQWTLLSPCATREKANQSE